MGLVKAAMMESQDRGWDAPETWVCGSCVGDEFLAEAVEEYCEVRKCSYCGKRKRTPFAAPTASILKVIADAVFYNFPSLQQAGIPYHNEGFELSTLNTREVLGELGLDGNSEFLKDIASAFHEDYWIRRSNAFWESPRLHQKLGFGWDHFVSIVKHKTRFHFFKQNEGDAYDRDHLTPDEILSTIAELLRRFDMFTEVPQGKQIYRCRVKHPNDKWVMDAEQLGAPPSELASAGRMNPAGISYFYGAFAVGTAIGEILSHPPMSVGVGTFITTHPLIVADLTKLPQIPSIFDREKRNDREALLFLNEFTRQISQPVKKNGMEHIDYIPSQVVSEYLAQVFEVDDSGTRLDGIIFPSSIKQNFENIVLFPSDRSWRNKFDRIEFITGTLMHLDDWQHVIKALSMESMPKTYSGVLKGKYI
jgi:hypothetical protein